MHATPKRRTPAVKVTRLGALPAVYATPTGVKLGSGGLVLAPGALYGRLGKSTARRLRKALRAAGFTAHAAAPVPRA
jgi:hypothetical protein